MPELSLPACPVCNAVGSLSRQSVELEGRSLLWYECVKCRSVLLWLEDDRWAYQKVGQEDKTDLLKKPMTEGDLQALLLRARGYVPSSEVSGDAVEQKAKRSTVKRPITWLLALCLVGLIGLVAVTVYQIAVGRNSFSPRKALLGHWVEPTGNTHYYFSQDKLVVVDQGETIPLTYTVLESSREERWIRIRVEKTPGMGHEKLLVFAPDKKSLEETATALGITVGPYHWDYVDDAREP